MKPEHRVEAQRAGWSALQWHLWSRWSLRRKLSIGVWLSVLPISLLTSLLALQHTKALMRAQIMKDLSWDAQETSEALRLWQDQQIGSLRFTAEIPAIRMLDPNLAQAVLDRRHKQYKEQSFTLSGRDGQPIAKIGPLQPEPPDINLRSERLGRRAAFMPRPGQDNRTQAP